MRESMIAIMQDRRIPFAIRCHTMLRKVNAMQEALDEGRWEACLLDAKAAEDVAAEITAAGGRAIGIACNVTKESDLVATVDATVSKFGKLTLLVNNAGGGGPKPFDMPMDDFRWAYEINVFGLFRLRRGLRAEREAAGEDVQASFGWLIFHRIFPSGVYQP